MKPLPHRQHGVVLIVALVMLVVIGLASVAVMRTIMNDDLVSENNRRHAQAMQAAQNALRYCEEAVRTNVMTPAAAAASVDAEAWHTFNLWKSGSGTLAGGGPVYPTDAFLNSSNARTSSRYGANRAPRPQCMAQNRTLPDGQASIVVTARGFSDNFAAHATTGETIAGAVVWLQSVIALTAGG